MSHIIAIGAGQAGSSLCMKLRKLGFDGQITLVGEESEPPYQRPPLSKKYLLGDMTKERLYLLPPAMYEAQRITLKLGAPVTAIDTTAQTVTVGDDVLPYDQLAFTTGSRPHLLPAAIGGDLGFVFAVRTLSDVDAMTPAFNAGGHVLIIGGGYIGLEAAAVAAMRGLKVTLVEMAPRILQRVASPETSDYFRTLHTAHGVDIREGVGLARLTGDGTVSGAELSDGSTLKIDFALVGVGISPQSALADATGIEIENGIKTDAEGRTSVPGVWAAGDCASFPYREGRIRLESVPNAIDQAEIVAANMLGAGTPYAAKPWFWSDQYDIKLQIAGLNTGYDRVVVRDAPGTRSHWYYAGATLLAVDAMNDPRGYMVGKRLIEAGKSPDPDAISNPDTDLKSLLKA